MTAETDGCCEFGNGNSGSAHLWRPFRLGFLKSTGEEYFAQQVTQGNVSPALQREIDAALHKFVFSFLESKIEGVKLAPFDVSGERQEELLQARVRLEQLLGGEGVRCQEMTRDEVRQDHSDGLISATLPPYVLGNRWTTHSLFFMASLWHMLHASVRYFSACE